jgi:hypothetical protein
MKFFDKYFWKGFWDTWSELFVLDLNPFEEEPKFKKTVFPDIEDAFRQDAENIAGDFKRAMEKADKIIEENNKK